MSSNNRQPISSTAWNYYRNSSHNLYPTTDINQAKLANLCEANQCPGNVPYPNPEDLPTKHIFFWDNTYLAVTATMDIKQVGKAKRFSLSTETRKAVQSYLAPAGRVSISMVPKVAIPADNNRVTLLLDCKTHNADPGKVLELVRACIEPLDLTSDVTIQLWNIDLTLNFPGTVWAKRFEQLSSYKMLGLDIVPLKNKHYNGYQSHSWKGGEAYKWGNSRNHRHVITDFDTGAISEGGNSFPFSVKLYSKPVMHLETTSVGVSGGNAAKNCLQSEHRDIQEAINHPSIQQYGFARLELRLTAGYLPEDMAEAWNLMAYVYKIVTPGNVSDVWTADAQYANFLPQDHKTLFVAKQVMGGWEWAHIRWGNSTTGNFNCESSGNVDKSLAILPDLDAVYKLAYRVQMADSPLVLLVDSLDGSQTITEFEPTGKLPDVELLPDLARKSKAAWRKVNPEAIGIPSFFFRPLQEQPEVLESEFTAWLNSGVTLEEWVPDGGSQKEYKEAKRNWLNLVQRNAKEQLKEMVSVPVDGKLLSKPVKFSSIPAKPILAIGEGYTKGYHTPYLTLANGKTYQKNKALEKQVGISRENPYILIRGKETGTYKGCPVYGDAKLVPLSRQTAEQYFPNLIPLFFTEEDYNRYKDVTF